MKELPHISDELLDALRDHFPDRLPEKPISETELAARVGQQQVIRLMERKAAEQRQFHPTGEIQHVRIRKA